MNEESEVGFMVLGREGKRERKKQHGNGSKVADFVDVTASFEDCFVLFLMEIIWLLDFYSYCNIDVVMLNN